MAGGDLLHKFGDQNGNIEREKKRDGVLGRLATLKRSSVRS